MKKYNLVDKSNCINPNYDISNKEISINIYVSHEREVCIVGTIDNNYIGWASITRIEDREENMAILKEISREKFDYISNLYNALGSRYDEVLNWHRFSIYRKLHPDGKNLYYSQASNVYLGDEEKYLAKFMVGEISSFYSKELSKCKFRLLDDSYLRILEGYLELLKLDKSYDYYVEMKPLIGILENESYLRLCPDDGVRKLYLECTGEASGLYNRYMSAVR